MHACSCTKAPRKTLVHRTDRTPQYLGARWLCADREGALGHEFTHEFAAPCSDAMESRLWIRPIVTLRGWYNTQDRSIPSLFVITDCTHKRSS